MVSAHNTLSVLHKPSVHSMLLVRNKAPVHSMLEVLDTLQVVQVLAVRHNHNPLGVGLQFVLRFR